MNVNKICVYAICKNEIDFVDKWLESMSEADYIVVLDTGSTDGTYERLLEDSRVHKVIQKEIKPWRFDVARNESMSLIPEDANICVCTDLDELFDSGWAEVLRTKWDSSKHKLAWYKYAWRHDEQGNPIKIFRYEKIHSPDGWAWVYPIHENLFYNGEDLIYENVLDVFEEIYLHHYMDDNKSRSSYLPLLELRKEEFPDELQTRVYLIQDYIHNNNALKCLQEAQEALELFEDSINSDVKSSIYLFMGDAATMLGLTDFAKLSYENAIQANKKYVEQYVALASIYMNKKDYTSVVSILQKCLNEANQYYVFFTRAMRCDELVIYDLLSVAYYNLNDWDNAFLYISKAIVLSPEDMQIKQNYEIIFNEFAKHLSEKTDNSILRASSPYEL